MARDASEASTACLLIQSAQLARGDRVERRALDRHYIAVHRAMVRDPLFSGAVLCHRYRDAGFRKVIQPYDPDALEAHRVRRRQRVFSELWRELHEAASSLQIDG
jgi:dihydrodipicolinate synthase/N-acetylneuraminate lyase